MVIKDRSSSRVSASTVFVRTVKIVDNKASNSKFRIPTVDGWKTPGFSAEEHALFTFCLKDDDVDNDKDRRFSPPVMLPVVACCDGTCRRTEEEACDFNGFGHGSALRQNHEQVGAHL
jgi:hypothetical protein